MARREIASAFVLYLLLLSLPAASAPKSYSQTDAPAAQETTEQTVPDPGWVSPTPPIPKRIDHVMVTATLGGTFHEAGISLANLVNTSRSCQTLTGITAVATAGTKANMDLLASGEAQLAILQRYAVGSSVPAPQADRLRTVTALWTNVEHFLIRSELARTGVIDDFNGLRGRPVYLGSPGSGSAASSRAILKALGIDADLFATDFKGSYAQAAGRLIARELDAASLPGGAPVSAVDQVLAALGDEVRLLTFEDQHIDRVQTSTGAIWSRRQVGSGEYPALAGEIQTIEQPVFLVATTEVEPEYVHCILDLMYGEAPAQRGAGLHPVLQNLRPTTAFPENLPYPLHEGACSFAAHHSLVIPKTLKPPGGCER